MDGLVLFSERGQIVITLKVHLMKAAAETLVRQIVLKKYVPRLFIEAHTLNIATVSSVFLTVE